MLGDDLRRQRSGSCLQQRGAVREGDGFGHCVEGPYSCGGGSLEGFRYDRRVDAFGEETICCSQKATCYDHDGGCPVTGFNVLGGAEVDEHFGSRVHDGHVFEHCVAVIRLARISTKLGRGVRADVL